MPASPPQAVKLIGVASGLGARDHGCADGPDVLRELGAFRSCTVSVSWSGILRPAMASAQPLAAVAELCGRLASQVEHELNDHALPLIVGGDHSCAIGTWSGVRHWLGAPLGLVWIDAHMDSHTFATSPTGALHGMPLACLLGRGVPALTNLVFPGPKLCPQHVCLLGVRSYEAGEAALLDALGVRVIGMKEVRKRGLQETFAEALTIARDGTAGYGISLDLDALDPVEEPGVGSPTPNGLKQQDLENALRAVHGDRKLLAMEIAEYNPHRDMQQLTASTAGRLLGAVLGD